MAKRHEELIPFLIKLSPIDKHIMDEMAAALGLYASDIIRLALWHYVDVPKSGVLKATLKELAVSRQTSFKMDILKELERSNNRQVFFIDGFKTMVDTYYRKYVPIDGVRKYVTIKLIALYTLFSKSKQRKNYIDYVRKHYLHYYPKEAKWITSQINIIKSLKKGEKDKLLLKLREDLEYEGNVPKVQEVERIDDGKPMLKLPAKGREADAVEGAGKA